MPNPVVSKGSATWRGNLFQGSGTARPDTSGLATFDVNWKARSEGSDTTTTPEELIAAIHAAAAGETALAPAIAGRLLARMRSPKPSLSARETEVLRLVADGATNNDIAARLHISHATVKSHLVHIYTKLDVSSRTAAVATARDTGLLR